MLSKVVAVISFVILISLEVSGQSVAKEYWEELADHSRVVIVGTAEDDYMVIRPEKFKLNPDGSAPSESEIYVGRIFRVKVKEKLKGKIKTEKIGENEYINIFLYWISGVPGIGDPTMLKGREYVLFLKPNDDRQLEEGKETIEFKPNSKNVRKPFAYKESYLVVDGFRGAVEIKTNKEKLIKEIKKGIAQ